MKLPQEPRSVTSRWFEDDSFWAAVAPILFSPARHAAAAAEVPRIVETLGLAPGSRVLDVFCGPGRHALPLQEAGLSVTGIDRTEVYLRAARTALGPRARLFSSDSASFGEESGVQEVLEGGEFSAGDPDKALAGPFDAAIWLGSSTGYAGPAGDMAVLRWIRERLGPSQKLLIDATTVEDVGTVPATTWEWFDEGFPDVSAVWRLEHTVAADPATSEHWLNGSWKRWELGEVRGVAFRHRVYSRAEWDHMLRDSGYRNILWYSDLGDSNERAASWVIAQAGP